MLRCIVFIGLFFSYGVLAQMANGNEACKIHRMAVDIGSGSTKFKLAEVDNCEHKIGQVLFEKSVAVQLKEDLAKSLKKEFSEAIIKDLSSQIQNVLSENHKYNPMDVVAFATAAFREAKNGKKMAKMVEENTGIKMSIISQKKEAQLGLTAVLAQVPYPPEKSIVWDVGGGSQQISTVDNRGRAIVFEGKVGSVGFKNDIVKLIQEKNPAVVNSPNPISLMDMGRALANTQKLTKSVPKALKEKFSENDVHVIGIGGVHNNSLKSQVKFEEKSYTIEALDKAIRERVGMTDQQVGGDYAATDISNLILIYGMMNWLQVKKVETVKASLSDAALVNPELVLK